MTFSNISATYVLPDCGTWTPSGHVCHQPLRINNTTPISAFHEKKRFCDNKTIGAAIKSSDFIWNTNPIIQ